ncbi:circadian clock-controlled protein daywake-like [Vanessa cardui]|uniref:circadian clock-controlled protein daywake-like n=1 Tax=Vanessa cardui TaxID=171605 RepID=UPI001F12AD3A|nr:circadian clock-controlled protein daywake-like [Vanessa cardui]
MTLEPIEGEGTCVISLSNVQYSFTIPFEIIEENGKNFVELKEYQYSYDVRDNAKFTLKNLYNGNKELSDSMLSRMNQNWRYLTVNFGRIFMDAVADRVYTTFRNYMLATPLKDFNTC